MVAGEADRLHYIYSFGLDPILDVCLYSTISLSNDT